SHEEGAVTAGKAETAKPAMARSWGRLLYPVVFVLWDAYLFFSIQSPLSSSSARLNLSETTIALLRLTIAVPYLLIWLAAAYAFVKVKGYAQTIKGSPEAPAFRNIAYGVLALLMGLMAAALLGLVNNFYRNQPSLDAALTIATKYSYVWPYLLAFGLLATGANRLARQHHGFILPLRRFLAYLVPVAVFAYVWLDLIFTNSARQTPVAAGESATYYLRDSLIVLTIVMPSLVTWGLGLYTALSLRHYHRQVKGTIYKKFLSYLVAGVTGVTLGSILLQALLSLGTGRLIGLGLGRMLGVIYLFLAIQLVGFLYIARGAKKLTKIEMA
ncbi:MAG TPA: hypothetical protein VK963_01830, partial [Candidatus Saccharimonadales bacterium]|nr:hypothetical protein [Candidatus Saccharimonadales bacterium]